MATRQKLGSWPIPRPETWTVSDRHRPASVRLAHLVVMQTIENVLSTSELADYLQVSLQTVYDLRSQGRGPRGFRVGRELRFRLSEVHAWLERLEAADGARHRTSEPGS